VSNTFCPTWPEADYAWNDFCIALEVSGIAEGLGKFWK
jgi:hypothetical protein